MNEKELRDSIEELIKKTERTERRCLTEEDCLCCDPGDCVECRDCLKRYHWNQINKEWGDE